VIICSDLLNMQSDLRENSSAIINSMRYRKIGFDFFKIDIDILEWMCSCVISYI